MGNSGFGYRNFLPQTYAQPNMDLLAQLQSFGGAQPGSSPEVVDLGGTMDAVGRAGAAAPTAAPSFMQGLTGFTDENGMKTEGWGGLALGAAQGLMGGYLGMKQYGLAKDQLAEGKRQFDQNFSTQRQLTNTRLEDRQRARVASNPGAYRSVGDYMRKNEVK